MVRGASFSCGVAQRLQGLFDVGGGDIRQRRQVTGQSGQRECPPRTTTYYLHVDKRDGTAAVPAITIYVQADPDAPVIATHSPPLTDRETPSRTVSSP